MNFMDDDYEFIDCGCRNLDRPCWHSRIQAKMWLMKHDGTHPGDFIGYHRCKNGDRVDIIRPETGDFICANGDFRLCLFNGTVQVVAEGTPLSSNA